MSHLEDKHVPLKKKPITVRPQAEWYTSELELEKRKRRRLEQIYRKDFLVQCAYYNELLVKTWQQFYVTKIEDSSGVAKTMVLTMITSGLDYCNSLYCGLPDCLLEQLYCVQKAAARLITLTGKYQHTTPAFIALHWLHIKERREFKILLLTYKCFNGLAPAYLEELLHKRPDLGSHRDNNNLLIVPKVNSHFWGDCI